MCKDGWYGNTKMKKMWSQTLRNVQLIKEIVYNISYNTKKDMVRVFQGV